MEHISKKVAAYGQFVLVFLMILHTYWAIQNAYPFSLISGLGWKQILNLPVSVRCHEEKKLPLLLSLNSIKGLVTQY